MSLVVDSSVVLKWVLPEPGRERALALIGEKALFAPDLLLVECADVLAVRAEQGRMSDAQAQAGLRLIRSVVGLLVRPGEPYVEAAQALALELRQSAHACLYLAMALAEGRRLATADVAFAEAVEAHGVHARVLRRLD